MNYLEMKTNEYLDFCQYQKCLDSKTLKAYRIDLNQFLCVLPSLYPTEITTPLLEDHIRNLHTHYKPKTAKRKIASLKAFFRYLEYRNDIEMNPFNKMQIKFREPVILPKTIPLETLENLLVVMYQQYAVETTNFKHRNCLRDIAVIELLFATGMRISELCSLKKEDVNLINRNILIYGKGSKERHIQIGSDAVYRILVKYRDVFHQEIDACGHFFVNQSGRPLSDQTVRRTIRKYASLAGIDMRITPHMFRHTFATSLLEADVDIRYIQEMLGHSSIHITEIYTHVAMAKQRDILTTKHPRKDFRV